MNKIKKATMALCLSMALLLGLSATAFAAEPATTKSVTETVSASSVSQRSNNYGYGVAINSSRWTTFATSTTGFNCYMYVYSLNAYPGATTHIRMLGKNGNVLWTAYDAMPFRSENNFWCGPDVYTIQAMTSAGGSSIYSHQGQPNNQE